MAVNDRILGQLDRLLEQAKQVEATSYLYHSEDEEPYELISGEACTEWLLSCVNMAERVAGRDSAYYKHLSSRQQFSASNPSTFTDARAAFRALREDYVNGLLVDFRELAAGEVFTDFLDMADHLSRNGYHVPAASLAGAVLEDALRRLHLRHIGQWSGDSSISKLNDALHKASVYPKPQWRQIQAWGDIRNDADHGHFDNVDAGQVGSMIPGIREFVVRYLT
jgi:hypothetical protein